MGVSLLKVPKMFSVTQISCPALQMKMRQAPSDDSEIGGEGECLVEYQNGACFNKLFNLGKFT